MAQELKAETIVPQGSAVSLQMYPKADVDAVLAEKDAEIRRLKRALYKDCAYWKTMTRKNADDNAEMAKQRAEALKRECRHKYKRCLAMARWCASRSASWCLDPADEQLHKSEFYDRWKKRWKNLAEKFKEAK